MSLLFQNLDSFLAFAPLLEAGLPFAKLFVSKNEMVSFEIVFPRSIGLIGNKDISMNFFYENLLDLVIIIVFLLLVCIFIIIAIVVIIIIGPLLVFGL